MADGSEWDGFTWVDQRRRRKQEGKDKEETVDDRSPGSGSGGERRSGHGTRITFQSPVVQSSPATRSAYDSNIVPLRPQLRHPAAPAVHQQLGFVDVPLSPPAAKPSAESGEAKAGDMANEVGGGARQGQASSVGLDWSRLLGEHSAGDASGKLSKQSLFSALEAAAKSGGSALVDSDQDFDSIWLAVAGDGSVVPTLADAAELLMLAEEELGRAGREGDEEMDKKKEQDLAVFVHEVDEYHGGANASVSHAAAPIARREGDAGAGKRLGHLDKLSNEVQELERYLVQSEWGLSHISLGSGTQSMSSRLPSSSGSASPQREVGALQSGGSTPSRRGSVATATSPAPLPRTRSPSASTSPAPLPRTRSPIASRTTSPATTIAQDLSMFDGVTVRRESWRERGSRTSSNTGSPVKTPAAGQGGVGVEDQLSRQGGVGVEDQLSMHVDRVEEGDSFTRSPVAIDVPTPTKIPNDIRHNPAPPARSVAREGSHTQSPMTSGARGGAGGGGDLYSRWLRGEKVDLSSPRAGDQDASVSTKGGRDNGGEASSMSVTEKSGVRASQDTGATKRGGGGVESPERLSRASKKDGAEVGSSTTVTSDPSPHSADRFRRFLPPTDKSQGKFSGTSSALSPARSSGGGIVDGAKSKDLDGAKSKDLDVAKSKDLDGAKSKDLARRDMRRGNDVRGDDSVGGSGDLDKEGVLKRLAERSRISQDDGRGRDAVMQRIAQRSATAPRVAQQREKRDQSQTKGAATKPGAGAGAGAATKAGAGAATKAGAGAGAGTSDEMRHMPKGERQENEGGGDGHEGAYSGLAFSAALDRIMRGLDDVVTCVSMASGQDESDRVMHESDRGDQGVSGRDQYWSGREGQDNMSARAGPRSPSSLGSRGRLLGQAGEQNAGYTMSERNPWSETVLETGVAQGGMHPAFLPSSPPKAQFRGGRPGASVPSLKAPWLTGGGGKGREGSGSASSPGHSLHGHIVAREVRDHNREEGEEDEDDLSTPRQRSAPLPIEAHQLVQGVNEAGRNFAGRSHPAANSTMSQQSRVSKTPSPIAPGKRLLLSSFTSPNKRGFGVGPDGGARHGASRERQCLLRGAASTLVHAQQRRQLEVRGKAVIGGRARDGGGCAYRSGRSQAAVKAVKAVKDVAGGGGSPEAVKWAATAKRVCAEVEFLASSAAAAPPKIAFSTSPPSRHAPPCPRPMPRPGSAQEHKWLRKEDGEGGNRVSLVGRKDIGDVALQARANGPSDDMHSPSSGMHFDGDYWPFGEAWCQSVATGAMDVCVRGLLDGACGDDAAAVWADVALGGIGACAWRRWRLDRIQALVSSEVARLSVAAEGECRRVRELEDEIGNETGRQQQVAEGTLTLKSRRDEAMRRGQEAARNRPFRSPHKPGSKSTCPIEEASKASRSQMHWHEDGEDIVAARSRGIVKLSLMRELSGKHLVKMCMLAMRSCVVRRHAAREAASLGEVQGQDVVYLRWGWAALRGRAERMRRVKEVEAALARRRCFALSRRCLIEWGSEAERRVHFREIVGDLVRKGNRRGVRLAMAAWKEWWVRQNVLRARLEAHVEGVALMSRAGSDDVSVSDNGAQDEEEDEEGEGGKEGSVAVSVLPRGRLAVASAAAEAMIGRARSHERGDDLQRAWSDNDNDDDHDDDHDDDIGLEGKEGLGRSGSSASASGSNDDISDAGLSKREVMNKSRLGVAAKAAEMWYGGMQGDEEGGGAKVDARRAGARNVSRIPAPSRIASTSRAKAGEGSAAQAENRSDVGAQARERSRGASQTRERSKSRDLGIRSETGSSVRDRSRDDSRGASQTRERSRGVSQTRERSRGVSQTRERSRGVSQTRERDDAAAASGSRPGRRIERGAATRIAARASSSGAGGGSKTARSGSGSASSISKASRISSVVSVMSASGSIDGDAARTALIRLKSFRAWTDAVSQRRADLNEVIRVEELYEKQLMLRCWSCMWLFARGAIMTREASRQTARANRLGVMRTAMSQWRWALGNKHLLMRVFGTCDACWEERERLSGEEGDFEALWSAMVAWKKEATMERQQRQAQVRAKAAHIFSRLRMGSRCMHAWHARASVCRGAAGISARGLVRGLRQCLASWAAWATNVSQFRCRWESKMRMRPAVTAWRAITFLGRAADERAAVTVLRSWRDSNEHRLYGVPTQHRDEALLVSGLRGLKGAISRKASKAVATMHSQARVGRYYLGMWSDEVRWDARLRWLEGQAEAHNLQRFLSRALARWSRGAKRRRMGGAGMAVAVLHWVGAVCRGVLRKWSHRAASARKEREGEEDEGMGEDGFQADDVALEEGGGGAILQVIESSGRRVTYGGQEAEGEAWGDEKVTSHATAQMSPIHAPPATPMPVQPGHAAQLSSTGPAMTIVPSFAGNTRTRSGKGRRGGGGVEIVDRRPSAIRSEKEAAASATARLRSERAAARTLRGHSEFAPRGFATAPGQVANLSPGQQGLDETWGMSSSGSSSLFDKENLDNVEAGLGQDDQGQTLKAARPREVGVRSGMRVASLKSRPPEGVELRMGGDVGMHIYPPLNPVVHANHVVVGAMLDGTLRSRRAAVPLPGSPQKTWRGDVTLDM